MPHKSAQRLYLDANDKVVDEKDPARVKLLVGKGGELPMEEARRYGLVQDAPDAPTAQREQRESREPGTPPEAAADVAASGRGGAKSRA